MNIFYAPDISGKEYTFPKTESKHIIKVLRLKFNDIINARELLPTNKINPFLIGNNYLNDLETQTKFLIPQNSQY
jgi:hypothetical protein